MGSIRKFIWRIIWLFSFCTLGITVMFKDGSVIKLESIWGEGEPVKQIEPEVGSIELDANSGKLNVCPDGLKDKVKLGCSPSTSVEYWDVR